MMGDWKINLRGVKEYQTLGPCPTEEDAVQVGEVNYLWKMAAQCERYKRQLEEMFPGVKFVVQTFPHDFGSYMEVAMEVMNGDWEMACEVEDNLPTHWNDEQVA